MKKMENGACGRRQAIGGKGIEECLSCGMPSDINQSDVDYLFWNVPLPLYITNEDGEFVGFNEEFLELFGYTREEMVNVKAPDIYVDTKDRVPLLETLVKTGEIKDYEVRLKRKDGEERICKIGAVVRKTETGNVLYYGFIRDITDRRQLHDAAEKNAALEASVRTAVGMAHDFNNLLTAIMGNADLAREFAGGNPDLAAKLEIIINTARRGQELVQRLHGYTAVGEPELLSINTVIEDVVRMMNAELLKHHDSIEIKLNAKGVSYLHLDQIHRVVTNLITNAIEASSENGIITVVTQDVDIPEIVGCLGEIPNGKYVMLSVSDNGQGISAENLRQIFEPYFTTKKEGSGLGLFNVWSIIQEYKGYINVITRTEPKGDKETGTTFQIYLPMIETTKSAEPSSIIEPQREGAQPLKTYSNLSILVVDNENIIIELLGIYLTRFGHRVTTANSAEEALSKYKFLNSQKIRH